MLGSLSLDDRRRPADHVVLLPLLVATAVTRLAGARLFTIYDDAFITYRYARNLVQGHGLVYNAGEWVLGITTPLFVVVPAFLEAIGLTVPSAMVGVNIACDLGVICVMYRILVPRGHLDAFVWFALMYAASPCLVRISVGGMEANLFVLTALLVVWTAGRKAYGAALIMAACATWLRPEALILLALVATLLAFDGRPSRYLKPIAAAMAFLLIPSVVLHNVYGSVIPQSVAAKAGLHSSIGAVLGQLLWPDPFAVAALPFAIMGAHRVLKVGGGVQLVLWWTAAYLAAYVARRPAVWSWYGTPTQCTLMLMAGFGIGDLLSRMSGLRWAITPWRCSAAGSALIMTAWVGLAAARGQSTVYQEMREWIEADNIRNSTVLAMDIGAIGFYSGAYIYDAVGLVSRDGQKYRSVKQMIVDKKPDYVMINTIAEHVGIMADAELQSLYEPAVELPRSAVRAWDLNPSHYSNDWRHAYFVFRRRTHVVPIS